MEELKKFKLDNKVLEDFDRLMTYHLDEVEEIEISEILVNPKIYNIISLCINVKTLIISGDLRVDVNKILFNICKPEKLETLILTSVKLPTTKIFNRFINLKTISLNDIIFSDVNAFFNRIENKDKIIALNLTNVDFGKRSIGICKIFKKLKYFNIDGLKNCNFDDLDFIYENKSIKRFEFYNNEIKFEKINLLCKGRYEKTIEVNVETSPNCAILNSFEIKNEQISLTVNASDLKKCVDFVALYKINNLFLILENDIEIGEYIRKFKKVKENVTVAIKDISYLGVQDVNTLRDRLDVNFVNILEDNNEEKINNLSCCYSVDDYIEIRKKFDEIVSNISSHVEALDVFYELYNYFKTKVKYDEEACEIKDIFVEQKSSYNLFAKTINSCLNALNIEGKIIAGEVNGEKGYLWNQVKLNDEWYNFDLGEEKKAKADKKGWQYVFKGILLTDEVFYKNHMPLFGNPEKCYTQVQEMKKELKNSVKKTNFLKKVFYKIKGIFKFNKEKALPAPDDEESKE
jgi:hypothetical protein